MWPWVRTAYFPPRSSMALFGVGMRDDPRCKPWAKITDEKRLVEILEQLAGAVKVEDCLTGEVFQISYAAIAGTTGTMMASRPKWRLVQAAPCTAPDTADELAV